MREPLTGEHSPARVAATRASPGASAAAESVEQWKRKWEAVNTDKREAVRTCDAMRVENDRLKAQLAQARTNTFVCVYVHVMLDAINARETHQCSLHCCNGYGATEVSLNQSLMLDASTLVRLVNARCTVTVTEQQRCVSTGLTADGYRATEVSLNCQLVSLLSWGRRSPSAMRHALRAIASQKPRLWNGRGLRRQRRAKVRACLSKRR